MAKRKTYTDYKGKRKKETASSALESYRKKLKKKR
jgi:hypothetical protein